MFQKEENVLIRACREKKILWALELINAGAEINTTDGRGMRALHWACSRGLTDVALALIKAGAEINSADLWQYTPLHRACESGHPEVTAVLIEAGAALDPKNDWGYTPLHFAYEEGDAESVALLIRAGARSDIEDDEGDTPSALGDPKIIEAVDAVLERKREEDLEMFKNLYMALCIRGVKLKSDEEPKNMPDRLLPMFLSKAAQKTRSEKVADFPESARRTHSLRGKSSKG